MFESFENFERGANSMKSRKIKLEQRVHNYKHDPVKDDVMKQKDCMNLSSKVKAKHTHMEGKTAYSEKA